MSKCYAHLGNRCLEWVHGDQLNADDCGRIYESSLMFCVYLL